MNAYPFSIFKRADRSCFSVSFKDANGKYLRPVSAWEFRFPKKEAAEIAFNTVANWLNKSKYVKKVIVNVFKELAEQN